MKKEDIDKSLAELKKAIKACFGDDIELYLFGSVARSDYSTESDIDILVLLPGEVDTKTEEEIFDLAFDIELKNNVIFGIVVHGKEFWQSEKAAVMPFHQNLQKEALRI